MIKINKNALLYFSREMATGWAEEHDLQPAEEVKEYKSFEKNVAYYLGVLDSFKIKEEFKTGLPIFLHENKNTLIDLYDVYDWNSNEIYECLTEFYKLLFPGHLPDLSAKVEFVDVPFEEWWFKFRENK